MSHDSPPISNTSQELVQQLRSELAEVSERGARATRGEARWRERCRVLEREKVAILASIGRRSTGENERRVGDGERNGSEDTGGPLWCAA